MANSLNETPAKGSSSPLRKDKAAKPDLRTESQKMADKLIENARRLKAERTAAEREKKPLSQPTKETRAQAEGILKNPVKPTPVGPKPTAPVPAEPAKPAIHPPREQNPSQQSAPPLQRRLTSAEVAKRAQAPKQPEKKEETELEILKKKVETALEKSQRMIPKATANPNRVKKASSILECIKQGVKTRESELRAQPEELKEVYRKAATFDDNLRKAIDQDSLLGHLERQVSIFFA